MAGPATAVAVAVLVFAVRVFALRFKLTAPVPPRLPD